MKHKPPYLQTENAIALEQAHEAMLEALKQMKIPEVQAKSYATTIAKVYEKEQLKQYVLYKLLQLELHMSRILHFPLFNHITNTIKKET